MSSAGNPSDLEKQPPNTSVAREVIAQQIDIEHVQVDDDPRLWSPVRKVCYSLWV